MSKLESQDRSISTDSETRVENRVTAPRLSIIVPCYNNAKYLCQCLDSITVFAPRPFEVIVVDDGSAEDIGSIVARYPVAFHYIRQPNQGPAAARNTGVSRASSPYLLFLDADDYLIASSGLQKQLALLESHCHLGLVHTQSIKVEEPAHQPIGIRRPPFATKSYIQSGWKEIEQLLLGNYITTSGVIVRRSVFEQVGGFRPELRSGEDWDCWLSIAQHAAIAHIAEASVVYRVHNKSLTAHYSVEPWLKTRRDILGRIFDAPALQTRFRPLQPLVEASLHKQIARLAYNSDQTSLARHHAWNALLHFSVNHRWRDLFECSLLLGKAWLPAAARPLLRTSLRRFRGTVRLLRHRYKC